MATISKAEMYDKTYSFGNEENKEIFSQLIKDLAKFIEGSFSPGVTISIFEPGAGTGLISLPLMAELKNLRVDFEYFAVDINEDMRNKFLKKLEHEYSCLDPNIKKDNYEKKDFWHWLGSANRKNGNTFDLILDFWFLHHLENKWKRGLSELNKLLKPGGLLLVAQDNGDLSHWIYGNLNNIEWEEWEKLSEGRRAFLNCAHEVVGFLRNEGHLHYREISAGYREPMYRILNSQLGFEECSPIKKEFEEKEITKKEWIDTIKAETFSIVNHIDPREKDKIKSNIINIIKACTCEDFKIKIDIEIRPFKKVSQPERSRFFRDEDGINYDFYELAAETIKGRPEDFYRSVLIDRLKRILASGVIENPVFVTLISFDVNEGLEGEFRKHIPIFISDDKGLGDTLIGAYIAHLGATINRLKEFRGINYVFRDFPLKGEFRVTIEEQEENLTEIRFENLTKDLEYIEIKVSGEEYIGVDKEEIQELKGTIHNKIEELKKDHEKYEKYGGGIIVNSDDIYKIADNLKDKCSFILPNKKVEGKLGKINDEIISFINFYKLLDEKCGHMAEIDFGRALEKDNLKKFINLMVGNINLINLYLRFFNGNSGNVCTQYSYFSYKTHEEEKYKEIAGAGSKRVRRQISTGGLMVGQNERTVIDRKSLKILLKLPFRTDAIHDWAKKAVKDTRKEALRSAIAAIMARNMSHNIGSHVLASPDLLKNAHSNEIQKLHNFLQQRMDFIAQVVTYTPSWGEPMFFFKNLLQGFFDQYLLLKHLIKDQGYTDTGIDFVVHKDSRGWRFISQKRTKCENCGFENSQSNICSQCGKGLLKEVGKWSIEISNQPPDFLIAIPGGTIGTHAFYDIVENIMRNCAKYGRRQNKLELHIQVEEQEERYLIKVWDNLSWRKGGEHTGKPYCACCVCKVQRSLQEELINPETGAMEVQSRGVHEMKECARILSYPYKWIVEHDRKSYPLWADAIQNNTEENCEYLAYRFYLQKPRLVGIVNAPEDENASVAKKVGVFYYNDINEAIHHANQLCLVFVPEDRKDGILKCIGTAGTADPEGKNHQLLPYRLVLVSSQPVDDNELMEKYGVPKRRLHWCRPDEISLPQGNNKQDWEHFVIEVYQLWLKKFKGLPQNGKWQMLIAFEREREHAAFNKWKEGMAQFQTEVMDVHVVRNSNHEGRAQVEEVIYSATSLSKDTLIEQVKNAPRQWLFYDNHGVVEKALGVFRSQLAFYHETGVRNLKIFNDLESPPLPGFGFNFFVLGLLETALTKVVVVDERVAEATYDENEGFLIGKLSNLREAKCYPVFSIWANDNERTFVSDAIENRNQRRQKIDDQEGLYLNTLEIKAQMSYGGFDQVYNADCIIIHQGVIDRLNNLGRWQLEPYLKALYNLAPFVVITSGRGKTLRYVPQTMPFIEFSIVRESTYAGMSKYHLVRALMSIHGESEGDQSHE